MWKNNGGQVTPLLGTNLSYIMMLPPLSDILALIPDDFRAQIRDSLVDFIVDQTRKYASEGLATQVEKLRSDRAFTKQFEGSLKSAVQRFISEYEMQDEDIVHLLVNNRDFFANAEVQAALLRLIKKPSGYLPNEYHLLTEQFSSVLPNRKNRKRVKRAISYFLWCLVQEIWHLPELQPVYMLLFQSITAKASLQQVELLKAQLKSTDETNSVIKDALLQLIDILSEKRFSPSSGISQQQLFTTTNIKQNLPQPDYENFIGRVQELQKILKLLRPSSQVYLISIDGIGGIGKSSLALEVARQYIFKYESLPVEERFQAIIWTSAKQTVLTEDGIISRNRVVDTLESILTSIAYTLGKEEIIKASPDEKYDVVHTALTQQRTLLIVDNLETVEDDDVMGFLRELPFPTKAIITTRYRVGDYPIRLTGMSRNDAFRLMQQECKKKDVELSERELTTLFNKTAGVPLAIVWSIGLISSGKQSKSNVLENLINAESDIAYFCFDRSFRIIENEYKRSSNVLLSLSLLPTSANPETLRYMVELPSLDQTVRELKILERFALVNKSGNRYDMLPMTRTYARFKLSESGLRNVLADRWVQWLIEWCQRYGLDLDLHINDRESIQVEFDNAIIALDWCYTTQRWEEYVQLAEGIFDYALMTNLFRPLGTIVDRLIEISITAEIHSSRSVFLVGYYFWYRGRYTKSLPYLAKARDMAKKENEKWVYAKAIDCLAHYHSRTTDNTEEARKMVDEILALAQNSNDEYLEYLGHYRLARIYEIEGELLQAAQHLSQAKSLTSQAGWQRLLAWTLYYEGVFLYKGGSVSNALSSFERGQHIAIRLNEQSLIRLITQEIRNITRKSA